MPSPPLDCRPPAHPRQGRPYSAAVKAGIVVGLLTVASIITVIGPVIVGPAGGFIVGYIGGRRADRRPLLPGLCGNVAAAAALLGVGPVLDLFGSGRLPAWPIVHMRAIAFVGGVMATFAVPGLLGGWLGTARPRDADSNRRPTDRNADTASG